MKSFLEKIKHGTDSWKIKKLFKPFYLPLLHRFKYRLENSNFKKEGDNILKIAHTALSEINLFYWFEFGTLLGVVRDGKLIEHDTDIDIGVFLDDYSIEIERTLIKHGFRKIHRFEIDGGKYGLEESYELNGVSFDIFYFTKSNDGMFCHLFPFDENKNHIVRELFTSASTFKTVEWQGFRINIHEDSDQRLRDTYGDYTIKIKDWYTPDAALNSEIINKTCKYYKY